MKDTPAARGAERTSDDHDPSGKRELCGNRCRQERFGDSRDEGSSRQRSGDSDSMVGDHGAGTGGAARVATQRGRNIRGNGEHRFLLDPH
jgi:hypothetical protein